MVPYRGLVTVCLAVAVAFAGAGHGPPAGLHLAVALAAEPDSDGDGCPEADENGPDETLGGQRDPNNVWDYFNPTHDGQNRVDDILAVVNRYFLDEGAAGYSQEYDRTYVGPNEWNLGPPNGQIRVDDVLHSVKQYFQDCGPVAKTPTLTRASDPVVLRGAGVPSLQGVAPDDLVAFHWNAGWGQVPVQVDERDVVEFSQVYNSGYGSGVFEEQYTDAGTFTGPDTNPLLDTNDEIAFMARDAGKRPTAFSEPAGVVADSGIEVRIVDPLDGGVGYVYLFVQTGGLDPGAGLQYVTYDLNLLSGPYLTTYNTGTGPNPEDSAVTAPYYAHHFSDRWISDEIRVTAGAATGVDILDRHKNLFAPGNCGRSEDTFSNGEGAFVVNKSGPVRALRSYVGANSGPLTQRENVFYDRRQDIRTFLRVHAIGGMMDFFDYSPAASGMTYYNDLNLSGVTIDGSPDGVVTGPFQWELVTGTQGSLVIAGSVSTNMDPFTPTSYYLDDSTPPVTQCTGDASAYGSSGLWLNQAIPCTTPDCPTYLTGTRTLYYEAPGLAVADAELRRDWASNPLAVSFSTWTSPGP